MHHAVHTSDGQNIITPNKYIFYLKCMYMRFAISRRVHRYRLSLRDGQAARGREEESGGLRPLAWGGNVDED